MANNFVVRLEKKDGKLVHRTVSDLTIYQTFIDELPEGIKLDMFISAYTDDGTLAQLAKVHAGIRDISSHTGEAVDDIKLLVKKRMGLFFTNDTEYYMKSFGDCSKEELGQAIDVIIKLGEELGVII